MIYKVRKSKVKGTVYIPSSKSDSQRAMLISALGEETSLLHNVGSSDDELSMIQNIQRIGAEINWKDDRSLIIKGNFSNAIFSELHVGESGLGCRLLTAISSLKNYQIEINGKGSLIKRNQFFFDQFLPLMGVSINSNEGKLPLKIHGSLKSGDYTVDGSESSQYISGLLIAFSQVEGSTTLTVENCSSKPYIDMTIHTLNSFGVKIEEIGPTKYKIHGRQLIHSTDYKIDGDWSSASYWLVAAALGLDVSMRGLSIASKQADKAILNALMNSNCSVVITDEEIKINGSLRKPLDFDATHCPDLFPALVTYAVLTEGISRIRGVHRLENKESDRGKALKAEFEKLGAIINIIDDTMLIEGPVKLKSSVVSSHDDHRIAMCLAIASLASNVELIIEDAHVVNKSYPTFWVDLEKMQDVTH